MIHHHADPVEAMARHEDAIADLYAAYAERFPDHEDFWRELVGEEMDHARWLRDLKKLVIEGKAEVSEDRFRIAPIERSIKYIEGYKRQAKHEEMTMLNALSIASDLEHALLEKKFLEVYDADDEHVTKTLKALQKATDGHRKLIDDFLNRMRQPGGPAIQ